MILIGFYDYKGRFIIENLEIMKMKVKINNLNTQHFKNFYLVFFFFCVWEEKRDVGEYYWIFCLNKLNIFLLFWTLVDILIECITILQYNHSLI